MKGLIIVSVVIFCSSCYEPIKPVNNSTKYGGEVDSFSFIKSELYGYQIETDLSIDMSNFSFVKKSDTTFYPYSKLGDIDTVINYMFDTLNTKTTKYIEKFLNQNLADMKLRSANEYITNIRIAIVMYGNNTKETDTLWICKDGRCLIRNREFINGVFLKKTIGN